MPSNPTRRSFIAASLVASTALPLTEALAIGDVERLHLMQRREHLQLQIAKLDRRWSLAYAKLPSWCRPGPKYRDRNGRGFGGVVGWPDAGLDSIKLESGVFLVRPSIRDIFKLRLADRTMLREESEKIFVTRLGNLVARLREKRRFERNVGLPRSSDWLRLEIELEEIDAATWLNWSNGCDRCENFIERGTAEAGVDLARA